jgi:hypothetical protein
MTALGPIVYAFFEQHLKGEKGLSPASVRSYRDALRRCRPECGWNFCAA